MTPYRAGVRAFHVGLPRTACPFEGRPNRSRDWLKGWDAAEAEKQLAHDMASEPSGCVPPEAAQRA